MCKKELSAEREYFTCKHGCLDGETISLPVGSTTTMQFVYKGSKGRYTALPARLLAENPNVKLAPNTLYWEPATDERSTRKTRSAKRAAKRNQS